MITLEEFLCAALLVPIGDPGEPLSSHRVIWGLPVKTEGLSGIGKTARVKEVCRAIGVVCHPVFVGTKQPEDFAGVFVPMEDGSVVVSPVLTAAKRVIEQGGGCIFLDEVNTAGDRTQAALLSFVDERRIGDQPMPNKTRFILAMNPTEYAAGGTPLTPALANRLAHLPVSPPSRAEWGGWLQGDSIETIAVAEGEAFITARWHDHWPQVLGLAAGFMQRISDEVLHKQPLPDDAAGSGAWPSPRTWYMGLRAVTTGRCLTERLNIKTSPGMSPADVERARRNKSEALQYALLKSLVGEGPANTWAAWVSAADLPSNQAVLSGQWMPDQKRLDISMAVLTSMTEYVKSRNEQEQDQLAGPAWQVLKMALAASLSDIVVPSAKALQRAGINRKKYPSCKGPCEDVIEALQDKGFLEFA